MKANQMFKPANPGNGESVENRLKAAIRSARARRVPTIDNSQNSKDKQSVGR
jgi:hypothetical protein